MRLSEILEKIAVHVSDMQTELPGATGRMLDDTSTLRGAGTGGTVHGSTVPDPTGQQAVNAQRVLNDRRNLEARLWGALREIVAAHKITDGYPAHIPLVPDFCEDCQRDQDSNGNTLRLSAYGGGAGPRVCPACRAKRDRRAELELCPSVLNRNGVDYRCQLGVEHGGEHRGDGWTWPNHHEQRTA